MSVPSAIAAPECPYPGLRAFFIDERKWYFGREAHVDEVLTRLETARFLAIVGSSGSGKSSLVFAGLIPALREGDLIGARRAADGTPAPWHIITFHPGDAPLDALATAIVRNAPRKDDAHLAGRIRAALEAGDDGLLNALDLAGCVDGGSEILVYADQFEELFRHNEKAPRAARENAMRLARLLMTAGRQEKVRLYVVLSMRSEAIGFCELFPGLPAFICGSQFLIPRLERNELNLSLRCPAETVGWKIEPGALNALLNDCGNSADDLPLAQHVLRRMWFRAAQAGRTALTLNDYNGADDLTDDDFGIGGIGNALSMHGKEILDGLPQPAGPRVARKLFMALCDQRSDGPLVRRHSSRAEIEAIAGADSALVSDVIKAFAGDDPGFIREEDGALDIRHEAIFRQWDRIIEWRARETESETWLRELAEAARDYYQIERRTEPWDGLDLDNALKWRTDESPNEAWAARYRHAWEPCNRFIEDSVTARTKRHAAESAKKWWNEILVKVFVFSVIIAGVWMNQLRNQARTAEGKANKALSGVQAEKSKTEDALRKTADALKKLEGAETALKGTFEQLKPFATDVPRALLRSTVNVETAHSALKAVDLEMGGEKSGDDEAAALEAALGEWRYRYELYRGLSAANELVRGKLDPSADAAIIELQSKAGDAAASVTRMEGGDVVQNFVRKKIEGRLDRGRAAVALATERVAAAKKSRDRYAIGGAVAAFEAAKLQVEALRDHSDIPLFKYAANYAQDQTLQMDFAATLFLEVEADVRSFDVAAEAGIPDFPAGESMRLAHEGFVRWVQFSADGKMLLTCGADHFVSGWDMAGKRVFNERASARDAVNAAAFSADGKYAAAASNGSTVRIYDLSSNPSNARARAFEGHSDSITSVDFDPTGRYIVSASADRTVRVFNAADASPVQSSGLIAGIVTFARFSPKDPFVVSSCDDANIRLHTIRPGSKIGGVIHLGESLAGPVRRAHFSGDGKWVVASASKTAYVRSVPAIADLQASARFNPEPYAIPHNETVLYSTFRPAPDGGAAQIVTCCADGGVRLIAFRDWTAKEPLPPLAPPLPAPLDPLHRGRAWFADWSADGRWLATCGDDGAALLWDCAGEKPKAVARLAGHASRATMVRLNADATRLATAGEDKDARLWDISKLTRQ